MRVAQIGCLAGMALVVLAGAAAQGVAPSTAPVPGGEYLGYVREVGFPAAAFFALFFLVRTSMREVTLAVQELAKEIRALREHCKGVR